MADIYVNTDDLYSEWSYNHAKGYTKISLLRVMKAIVAYRNAQIELRKAYDRLPADGYFNLDYINGTGDWEKFAGINAMTSNAFFSGYPHTISNPRLSDNRYGKNQDIYPMSVWEKQTRNIIRDTKKLNAAIDKAMS